ncbi:MAG: hypothetical protein IJT36_06075 [Alphaproteobacteria bacterium]|nr:hypothetical protein [Alphaproteobacteria bacterium]
MLFFLLPLQHDILNSGYEAAHLRLRYNKEENSGICSNILLNRPTTPPRRCCYCCWRMT